MSEQVKYPQVRVELAGEDGNAFSILGRVTGAMREAGLSEEQRKEFLHEATSGDYNHLLMTVLKYVTVDQYEDDDEPLWGDLGEEDDEEE